MPGGAAAEHEAAGLIAKAAKAFMRDAAGPTGRAAERDVARDAERTSVQGAEHALNDADRAALKDYTSHHYGEINAYNRNPSSVAPDVAADLEQRSQAISDALGKLPAHEGTVYRGGQFPEDVVQRYRVGESVREDAFTSTSTGDPFPGNTQMTIESRTGRSIEDYTSVPGENEVLFDRGTSFKVLSHDVRDGTHYISMTEV